MNRPRGVSEELQELLDALCDESISPQQLERLEQLILSQPEAEAYYVQYMSLHADLISRLGMLPTKSSDSLRTCLESDGGGTVGVWRRIQSVTGFGAQLSGKQRMVWFGAGIGIVSLVLAMAVWGLLRQSRLDERNSLVKNGNSYREKKPASELEAEAFDDSVAVLWQADDAVWESTSPPLAVGSILKPGWLRLLSGLVSIEFYSGATVILEGPANFQVVSRNEGFCESGTLWATVPPQAHGFRVGSPELTLVDRGTEFGLRVVAGGPTEVHVFRGSVELGDDKSNGHMPATTLTTGQGLRLDDRGAPSAIELNAGTFQSIQKQVERFEKGVRDKQKEWLEFCAAQARDPSLLVHFPFVSEKPSSRTLVNHAASPTMDYGVIVGCSWESGRWPEKQALGFNQVSDRVRFRESGEHKSLTLMAWVRVEALPNRFNSLMMTDGWEDGEPHWHIGSNGTLELGIQGPNKKSNAHYEAREALSSNRLGQWLHLAVVYNGEERYVAHFIDGHVVAQLPLQFDIPLHIGDAEVGNWNVSTHRNSNPVRNLDGCIDDFMLFARALSHQEIEQFHTAGQPPR